MSRVPALVLLLLVLVGARQAHAHPLAPSSLRIVEADDGTVVARFRTPSTRPVGSEVVPALPRGCAPLAPPRIRLSGSGVEEATRLRCDGGIVGKTFVVRGLAEARTDVVWQVTLADGTSAQGLLHEAVDRFEVPSRTRPVAVFLDYLRLGVEHLLTGFDHVLFVLALLFVLDRRRALVVAVTAFTIGHSASLALAALDLVQLPQAPVELAIAASLLFMAFEILERHRRGHAGELERRPAVLSGFFGLVHGLGFAGVLVEAGLPGAAVPEALLGFNVGIELGQLALVASALALAALARRTMPTRSLPARVAAAYLTGSLAAMWVIERGLALVV